MDLNSETEASLKRTEFQMISTWTKVGKFERRQDRRKRRGDVEQNNCSNTVMVEPSQHVSVNIYIKLSLNVNYAIWVRDALPSDHPLHSVRLWRGLGGREGWLHREGASWSDHPLHSVPLWRGLAGREGWLYREGQGLAALCIFCSCLM